ncbi:kinesin-domain-containing protein, partial [Nadsonia fulvescens var. elongata DSM 6958]
MSESASTSGHGANSKAILHRNNSHRINEVPEEKESNIHVYVRCRGRNEREIKENSGVVVQTTGDKGREVMLQMGPMALSNKTYTFDRVFGPEADQSMLYDGIADKILKEMISGYNCTIFAYGQTGTGKTFTMSGDLADNHGRPAHDAGIIPRTLFQLFRELDKETAEYSVKVSYIELYNEELRDLISQDDDRKVKIFDDANKKGIVIQGMEEAFIKSPSEGLQILQDGSYKRQVAATKCNDLSSRSHSVFTITIHVKEVSEDDQEFVRIGKLNLVDLAGSENINRSGAQDMRAREAGMINQSLLTLGRVINALVDRSPHIPYRESKLTRLLQDSLGGRTKTCIIATVSPAKVSLEETISTLDYANRAKNIKNKPQVNQTLSKKMVLGDYVLEIERLRADLMATRQKTGIYLSEESHQNLLDESESRRALVEEQKLRVDALESQLKTSRDGQEELMKELSIIKKDFEKMADLLESTNNKLNITQNMLDSTENKLNLEKIIAKDYEYSLNIQRQQNCDLTGKLEDAIADIKRLHSKIDRRAALENLNKAKHDMLQSNTQEFYTTLNKKLNLFKASIIESSSVMEHKVEKFLEKEVTKLSDTTSLISQGTTTRLDLNKQFDKQLITSKMAMEGLLNGISDVKNQIKSEISSGLEVLRTLAKKISVDILQEFQAYQAQNIAQTSQIQAQSEESLKKACAMIATQAAEIKVLKDELLTATKRVSRTTELSADSIIQAVKEEKARALQTHDNFIKTITEFAQEMTRNHNIGIENRFSTISKSLIDEKILLDTETDRYASSLAGLEGKNLQLDEHMVNSGTSLRNSLMDLVQNQVDKGKLIETNTDTIHQGVSVTLDDQIEQLDDKFKCLDTFVKTAQTEFGQHASKYEQTLQ